MAAPTADIRATAARLFPERTEPTAFLNRHRAKIMPVERLLAAVPQGASVLDVGCGAGLFLGLLVASGRTRDGVGFDTSARAIELACRMRARLPEDQRIRFELLSVEDPWPEGRFDVVSLIDVIHHIPPAAQMGVIDQAVAKLTPGGLILYKDMASSPVWMALANRMHDLMIARDWIHYLPIATVREALSAKGFELVEEMRTARLWYMHEMIVMRAPL